MEELTGTKANTNYKQTITLKNCITKNLLQLGRLLIESKENEYFKAYADTFTEYLGTPEISLSRSFAFKIMFNYTKWVIELGISQAKLEHIDSEKLYLVGVQADEGNYEEWLERAKTLSRSDIREMVGEVRGGSTTQVEEYKQVVCPSCGHSFGVRV